MRHMAKAQVLVRGHIRRKQLDIIVKDVKIKVPKASIKVQPTKGDFQFRQSVEAPSDADVQKVVAKVKAPEIESLSTYASE